MPTDSNHVVLVWALISLGSGPLVYEIARRFRILLPSLDGFVLGSLGGLALVELLPDTIAVGGVYAVVSAALGFALLALLEKHMHWPARRAHLLGLLLSIVGLLFHTIMDGMAAHSPTRALGYAVVVHHIPFSLALWWMIRPRLGVSVAVLSLLAVAASTAVGFFVGGEFADRFTSVGAAVFQAFVAGALLHVIGHAHSEKVSLAPKARKHAELIGFLFGVVVYLFFFRQQGGHTHEHHESSSYLDRFLDLTLEASPALLLGYSIAGVVVVYLPQASMRWLHGGGTFAQALKGTVFGLPIPVCSCGVVPLYQGLFKRGAPKAAAIAFLVATPELGLDAFLLSFPLLGSELAVARLVAALAVALFVGFFFSVLIRQNDDDKRSVDVGNLVEIQKGPRVISAIRYGFAELVDDTAAWIVAGIGIAAAIEPSSLASWLSNLPRGSDVVLAAIIGAPIYVCAAGATPLGAALIGAGVSPGAALTFLLSGPATNMTTLGALTKNYNKRAAAVFTVLILVGTIAAGYVTNFVVDVGSVRAAAVVPHSHSVVTYAAAAFLCLLFLMSMWRLGPRGFVYTVLSLGGHEHDDEHTDDDTHRDGEHDDHGHLHHLHHHHHHHADHEHEGHHHHEGAPSETNET